MRPPSLHCNFFNSIKQVEKKMKLDNQPDSRPSTSTSSQVPETNPTPTESLGTPLHLHLDHPTNINTNNTLQDSSETPQAFLSSSPQFLPTHQIPPQINLPDPPQNNQRH
ncbi:hypothetical protein CRYUN_Cryun37aG0086200 [Craigia yunnanensis]